MSHNIPVPSKVITAVNEPPKSITVELTIAHIREGNRKCKVSCPFALAFRDAGYPLVGVGNMATTVRTESGYVVYNNPAVVSMMIYRFDNGGTGYMRPGTYTFTQDDGPYRNE